MLLVKQMQHLIWLIFRMVTVDEINETDKQIYSDPTSGLYLRNV